MVIPLPQRVTWRGRAYLVAMVAGIPAIAAVWVAQAGRDPFVRYAYPVMLAYLLVSLWSLLRRPERMRTFERRTFLFLAAVWLIRLVFALFSGDPAEGWRQVTPWLFMALPLLTVLGYVVFDTRTALRCTSAIPAVSTAVGLLALAPAALAGRGWTELVELLRYEMYVVVTMVFVHVLAKHKDDAAASQLEAERMRTIANHDTLTGLPNRRRLEELLEINVAAAERDGLPLSVIALDLDRFKDVNDAHGHPVGDAVLKEAAQAACRELRPRDTLGRWGGEEFLVVLPDVELPQAAVIAERVREAVARQEYSRGVTMTASVGVADHRPGDGVAELVAVADAMLYEAKAAGRNTVRAVPAVPAGDTEQLLGSAVERRDEPT